MGSDAVVRMDVNNPNKWFSCKIVFLDGVFGLFKIMC